MLIVFVELGREVLVWSDGCEEEKKKEKKKKGKKQKKHSSSSRGSHDIQSSV